ncbi:MAG: alpha/beta hydrolase, partial [Actinomycetota bacterium]|nr:alpha/beta hydrolase [Actinomycetota bacterium]
NLRRTDGGSWRWRANLDLLRSMLDVITGFPEIEGASFDGPVLWVGGERSNYIAPQHAERMRELFPRTRQLTVKDSGHWVHSEQPAVFTQALRVFLAAND